MIVIRSRFSLEAVARLGFIGAVALLLLVSAASWRSVVVLRARAAEDHRAQAVLTQLESLRAALNGAMVAQRSYMITGDTLSFGTFMRQEHKIARTLDALRRTTATVESLESGQIARLDSLLEARLAHARVTMTVRSTAGFTEARRAIMTGRGGQIEQSIRAEIDAQQHLQRELLARHQTGITTALRRALLGIAAASAVSMLFVAVAYGLMRRYLAARRHAEGALRDNEERYRALVTGTSQIVWRATAAGRFELDAPEWRAFTGQSVEDYRAGRWLRALHPDDRRGALAAWRRAVGTSEPFAADCRIRGGDGQYRHFSVHGVPVCNADGVIREWIGACLDVTERRQAEAHARLLTRLYRVLSETNQLIVREQDPQHVIDGACRILVEQGGFMHAAIALTDPETGRLRPAAHAGPDTSEAMLARIFADCDNHCVLPALALATASAAFCSSPAGCELPCYESGFGHRNGRVAALPLSVAGRAEGVFVLYAEQPERFDGEELGLLDELALDIGFALSNAARERERQRVLEELVASEERFRELTETIEEIFWVTDAAKSRMLYVSPGYDRIWGRPREQLYESPVAWLDAIHADDRERVLDAAMTKQVAGEYDEEYRIVRPDGTMRWIRDRAFRVLDANGAVVRMVGSARDITDQRQLEEQFRQSQKLEAVGRLAGGVAHDFNNLLTVILSYADLLHGELPESARSDCDEIRTAAQRARDLTRQLLAFSRRQPLKPETVNLSDVVSGTEGMLRRLIGADIHITTTLDPALGATRVDRSQIEQVILNLAVNACDAMPGGGDLTIATANEDLTSAVLHEGLRIEPGRYVALTVADTGVGMDVETRSRIFEPFFTTKPVGKGTGLGLATVYGIVRQSGGDIGVYSEPGVGTTFRIYLPRTDEPVSATVAAITGAAAPKGAGERILLVEDEGAVRGVVRRILTKHGYCVIEAGTAEEALERVAEPGFTFDLLLTDVVLPGISGPALADHLAGTRPNLRVVLASGYMREELGSANAHIVLQKPFTADTLLHSVREALS